MNDENSREIAECRCRQLRYELRVASECYPTLRPFCQLHRVVCCPNLISTEANCVRAGTQVDPSGGVVRSAESARPTMMIRRRAAYTLALVTFGYLLAARVMLAPICNFSALTTASFGGDARLIIWTLAWDNHALLDREPSLF